MFDVAVIGAGPSGSLLAQLLASSGYSTAILEEHASPGDSVNCSGIIGKEAFDRFALPSETILRAIHSFRFFAPDRSVLEYSHPEPLSFAVDRSRFDAAMAQTAVSAGASLFVGSRVVRIQPGNRWVEITVNEDTIVKSKFVVIATGAGSRLPEQVGLTRPQRYVLGAQAECETDELKEVEIHFGHSIAPSNFAWVIPLQPNRAKIGLMCDRNAQFALTSFLTGPFMKDRLYRWNKILCSLLPLETISRSYAQRTLVIGEAAGQIKTITCGGIYFGMLAAEIAAKVLKKAIEKNSGDIAHLAPYESGWRALLQQELDLGLRVRTFFSALSDAKINSLFDIALKDGIMKIIREKVNFDWHHDLVYAIFKHSLVKAALQPIEYGRLLF